MNTNPLNQNNEDDIPDIVKLKMFVAEYEKYFNQKTSPLELEPEMLDGYVKRNKLTDEQREFLMQRPHYIYASQAMDILKGQFSIDDYYLIRNSNYYTKPLSKFLAAEILKTNIMDKINEFRRLQQGKVERNIYDVNVLDAHGGIEPGYIRVPDGITLCFTSQPFHIGFGDVENLLYQLQNKENIKSLTTHPMCYGKYSNNNTYRHMIVYFPGQMVPNMTFSPDVKPNTYLHETMGYYSSSDIAKQPVTYDADTDKYTFDKIKSYIPMRTGKHNTLKTEDTYRSFSIAEFMEGTSYIGPVSGVIIIDSCRVNTSMSSYEHESLNRYESFINILNYVVTACSTKNKSSLSNEHGNAQTRYSAYFKYYDKIADNHIPVFDYRLLPDYMFDILSDAAVINAAKLKTSLVRRAFKIRELIDKYHKSKSPAMYKAEQLANNFNKVPKLAGPKGYDKLPVDSLVRRINALLDIENDAEAVKLVAKYMDNDKLEPNHGLTESEIGNLLYSWIDYSPSKNRKRKSGWDLYELYYKYLGDILIAAINHKCMLTINYIIENDTNVITQKTIFNISSILNGVHSNKDKYKYMQILCKFISVIVKSSQTIPHAYDLINIILENFNTLEHLTLLFKTVSDYDTFIYMPFYTIAKRNIPFTMPINDSNVYINSVRIPLYYLYLLHLVSITRPDYKKIVEDAFKILVSNNLHTTKLLTGSDYKLHVIPYLCKEYMDNPSLHLWSLGKIIELVSKLDSIEYPIYNHQTLIILQRGLQLNKTAIVKLIMQYVYPKHRTESKYAFILAAQNPKWFKTLINSIPYKVPEYVLYLNSNSPGRPLLRNVLPKSILTQIEPPHNNNVHTLQSASNSEEEQINKNKLNNNDLIAFKYAPQIARLTAKLGKRSHRSRSRRTTKAIN